MGTGLSSCWVQTNMSKDDRTGQIIQARYRLLRLVGGGSQGKVYQAEDLARAGEVVALKLVEELVGGRRDTSADHVLRWFRHPHWATVLDVGSWGDSGWFEVTRFVQGDNLLSLEGPQDEKLVLAFLEQGARVLGALHRRRVIHYDITPGNWMLEWRDGEPHFVLTDGGLAHLGPVKGFGRGTPRYMAPEMTQEGEHDHRVDLYSLGLVAYRLATGREPFEGPAGEVLSRRRNERVPAASSLRAGISNALESILGAMLRRSANRRLGSAYDTIQAIGKFTGKPVAATGVAETAELLRSGQLLAFDEELSTAMAVLDRVTPSEEEDAGAKYVPPKGPVVAAICGPRGSGSTRLTRALLSQARARGISVVYLDGSAYAGASLRPMRDLFRCLSAVAGLDPDAVPRVVSAAHALERIVQTVERAAAKGRLLFVVESVSDLGADAAKALIGLARYAQSRAVQARSQGSTIGLVLDMGTLDTSALRLPDRTVHHYVEVAPPRLTPQQVRSVLEDKIPGIHLSDLDLKRIHSACEGRPGSLIALAEVAFESGDVRRADELWTWETSATKKICSRAPIPTPMAKSLLASASDRHLDALALLALFPAGLPKDASAIACLVEGESALRMQPLLRMSADGMVFVRDAALGSALLDTRSAASLEAIKVAAHELLSRQAPDHDAVTTAATLCFLGETSEAVGVILRAWDSLQDDDRARARELLATTIGNEPALCRVSVHVKGLCEAIAGDEPSRTLAAILTESALRDGLSSATLATLLDALLGLGMTREAARIVGILEPDRPLLDPNDLQLALVATRVLQSSRHTELARSYLARVLRFTRHNPEAVDAPLLASMTSVRAQVHAQAGRWVLSRRLLERALANGSDALAPAQEARLRNNLGNVYQELENWHNAEREYERSRCIRQLLGDVRGDLAACFNLGRLKYNCGDIGASSALLQSASAVALRQGLNEYLAAALISLAEIYDHQMNSALALSTLDRAACEARASGSEYRGARASWSMAPIAAAAGDYARLHAALSTSARFSRNRTYGRARLNHALARLQVSLHQGSSSAGRHARSARRLSDRSGVRLTDQEALLVSVGLATDGTCPLPEVVTRALLGPDATPPPGRLLERMIVSRLPSHQRDGRGRGASRRAVYEIVLRDLLPDHIASTEALDLVRRHSRHAGEDMLRCRTLARMATRQETSAMERAHQFSEAVSLFADFGPAGVPGSPISVPTEFRAAFSQLADRGRGAPRTLAGYQALAHQLVTRVGAAGATDERLSSALRQVLRASVELDATGDLAALLDTVTRLTVKLTGAERAFVVRVSAGGELQTAAVSGPEGDGQEGSEVSHAVIRRAIDLQKPLLLHDVFGDEELMQRPSISALSLRSIMCVPMVRRSQFYGVVYADHSGAAASFDQVDLEILSLFADQVASVLETRTLLTDLQSSMSELREAQERLVRGERLRTLGELSSGVAHEFNNLLTGILARLQLLRLEPMDPGVGRELGLVEDAALDAARIVRRLQTFTRRQQQRGFEIVDLGAVCAQAVEFLRPLWASNPGTSVRVHCPPETTTQGNPTELREVVTNLVKNALDASQDRGDVVVRVTPERTSLLLEVLDRGCGIPEEAAERVFDPFFTTKGERGTGLGLSLCADIIERHGGDISTIPRSGGGTIVRTRLPLAPSDTAPSLEPDPLAGDAVPQQFEPLSVLVVDDDENVLDPIRQFLEASGYEVRTAKSGREALTLLLENPDADVVLTDISMPEIDGVELCRRARQRHPEITVILMTGRPAVSLDLDLQAAGARALLAKPFPLQSVDALLQECRRA